MVEEFHEKKDDLKTTITPEEVIQQIKEKLPELKEIEVFGNKFKNVEVIFWLCIICLPLILLLSFRKNELWSLLNLFWCLGILYYQIHLYFLNYLIYSNFGNILFQLLYVLFYIWDLGTVYELEGNTGKSSADTRMPRNTTEYAKVNWKRSPRKRKRPIRSTRSCW